jgi:ABC-type lipoprotein release transport system permease subunit
MAWRNLWRHKRRTWLTAMAMIFSNVLLVFMIALQFGSYDMMIENTLKAFSGHVQVQAEGYDENPKLRTSIAGVEDLALELRRSLPEARVAARAVAFALASSDERSFGVQLVGVQPAAEPQVSTLPGLVREGRFLEDPDAPEIVIGVVIFAAGIVEVVGIFDSGVPDLDRGLAEVPLHYFQDTFSMQDRGNTVAIALPSLAGVATAVSAADAVASTRSDLVALDWNALHPGLKQAIQADLSSAWFMYGVLIVLVAFSVLNTQLMSVLERTREFGVIGALGVRPRKLVSLIMLETALMSTIGLAIGLFLGWLVALYFNVNGFSYPGMDEIARRYNLPGEMYPSITLGTMLVGPGVVFAFCLLASAYPALRLLRLRPVDAMQAA